MKKIMMIAFCFVASFVSVLKSQNHFLNTELLANIGFNENSSDIWGFEKDGIKYAIIGNATKTSIFSLEDFRNPILRYEAQGAQSIWRDIKSYNNHIYITTDQGTDGLFIIDMEDAPLHISHTNFKPILQVGLDNKSLQRCHNLYIDEKGFCYLAGCNISQRGVIIFDLKVDPKSPVFIGAADLTYAHDAFARRDTLYASEINAGRLSIYDIKDRSLPKLLASQTTSRAFTHNAWPSDDGKFIFTTDERSGGYVDAYDISDLNNIKLLDKFRPLERENDGVIPHNTHYKNGYLVTSWYTDGLRIIDAHRPDNLIEVAYYDTWEDQSKCHNGYYGCWGAFPFTNSDVIYGSDINNGLFIVDVDYQRACYLEGKITDMSGNPISNAIIEILSDQLNHEISNPAGIFKTGQVGSGSYFVRISHPDYLTIETNVILDHGQVTPLNVQMSLKHPLDVEFILKDKNDNSVFSNILLRSDNSVYNFNSGGMPIIKKTILSSTYDLFISSWGYENIHVAPFDVKEGAPNKFNGIVKKGYSDNFEIDLTWSESSTSGMTGKWERGIPRQTEFTNGEISNPGQDSEDAGHYAYVTGNGQRGASCDDVDNGTTKLFSPVMDLTTYSSPALNYDVWFFIAGGNSLPNDTLVVKITDGIKEVIVDRIYSNTDGWFKVRDIDVKGYILPTNNMQLIVEASDSNPANIVEAGFDNFFITDLTSGTKDLTDKTGKFSIVPNPASEKLNIIFSDKKSLDNLNYSIYNVTGQIIQNGKLDNITLQMDVDHLYQGFYFISIGGYKPVRFIKN